MFLSNIPRFVKNESREEANNMFVFYFLLVLWIGSEFFHPSLSTHYDINGIEWELQKYSDHATKTSVCVCEGAVSGFSVWRMKEPSLIFQLFQIFWKFSYHKKAHIFLIPNSTAEKCSIWKVLMKMCLIMVTIIKHTQ